jgi:RimJ/RimL family protein N-acetyltransferase
MSLRGLLSIAPLKGDHVTLRRPGAGDAETIARYIGDDDVQAWLSGSENAHALYGEYTAGWDAPDDPTRLGLTLIVTRSGDDTLVGVVHLAPSDGVLHVGYGVAPDHRGLGIASEALALCSAWAIENGFDRVELEIGEDNQASQAVARRCDFEPTSRTRTQALPRWRGLARPGVVPRGLRARFCSRRLRYRTTTRRLVTAWVAIARLLA